MLKFPKPPTTAPFPSPFLPFSPFPSHFPFLPFFHARLAFMAIAKPLPAALRETLSEASGVREARLASLAAAEPLAAALRETLSEASGVRETVRQEGAVQAELGEVVIEVSRSSTGNGAAAFDELYTAIKVSPYIVQAMQVELGEVVSEVGRFQEQHRKWATALNELHTAIKVSPCRRESRLELVEVVSELREVVPELG
ncbi:unnamed protein product [Closterium sp. NIES-64]|nr:unnamed protein product [Closterium sp. NIES-64]